MIILDTNVVSELMKPLPSSQVLTWLDKQMSDELYLTSVSIGEILYGLQALPKGKRRESLETAFKAVMDEAFKGRTLPFDDAAAFVYGKLMASTRAKGKTMSFCDGQIAAISFVHQGTLATRNMDDFKSCGLSLINPFQA